jgi:hypothetical protein
MKFVLLKILIATIVLLTVLAALHIHGSIGILIILEIYLYYLFANWVKKKKAQLTQ